ncbi:unnamed protein product [Urochloa humidicola]
MASRATVTVLFGFYAVLCCLHPLEEAIANKSQTTQSSSIPRLAAAALVPAVLTTLTLTVVLLYAHVWALGRANARRDGGGAWARVVVARLADATLLVAVVALVSAAVVRLGGDELLGVGGADDVGWVG